MTDRYPLIKSVLELDVHSFHRSEPTLRYVHADDLERALENGVRVYSNCVNIPALAWYTENYDDTSQTGLVVGITPIERDDETKVLRDFVSSIEADGSRPTHELRVAIHGLYHRAKKVLGEK